MYLFTKKHQKYAFIFLSYSKNTRTRKLILFIHFSYANVIYFSYAILFIFS
jgi:hypothetical protein